MPASLAPRPVFHPVAAAAHLALLGMALSAGTAQAAPDALAAPPAVTPALQHYQIAAGPLGRSLAEVAAGAGMALSFDPALTQGLHSPAVSGNLAPREALQRLLAGSGLGLVQRPDGSYSLQKQSVPQRETASLAEVKVTAQAEPSSATEGTGSYASTGPSATATRLNMTLKETPQTVSVMTRQRMDDQKLDTVAAVLEQTPGLSVQNVGSSRFSIYSRGNTIDNYQLDGIVTAVDFVSQNIPQSEADMAIYDRVEVLRGAAGLLVGAGDPSGTINLVRKKPTRDFQGHVSAGVGSWERRRLEADVSGPLNESGSLRGRLVGAHESGGTHVDFSRVNKSVLYAVLEADLGPATTLTLGVDTQRNAPRGGTGSGLPLFYSNGVQTDFAASANAGARWNTNRITATNTFAALEHRLANDWTLKLSGNHLHGNREGASADASWGFPDKAVGDVELYGGMATAQQRQSGFDVHAQGPFTLLGRQHEAVLGFNWSQFENLHQSLNTVDEIEGRTINLYRWNNETERPVADGSKFMDYNGWQKQYGAYGALRLKPRDGLAVILGARLSHYAYRLTSLYPDIPRLNKVTSRNESGVFTPYAGIVYDLNAAHSIYASYTSIFKPQSTRDRTGNVLDPREGRNYEIGLKSSLLDGRVQTAVALYQIRQNNLAEVDNGHTVPNTRNEPAYRAVDGATTRGLDLELNGELRKNWQVGVSYNYSTTHDADGTRINTVFPRQMARLWSSYRLSGAWSGLTVGGGLNWQSRTSFSTTPWQLGQTVTAQQKSYVVAHLMARYDFDRQWSATLNFNNVFNKKYLQGFDQTFYTGYYAPTRNAMLNLKYQF